MRGHRSITDKHSTAAIQRKIRLRALGGAHQAAENLLHTIWDQSTAAMLRHDTPYGVRSTSNREGAVAAPPARTKHLDWRIVPFFSLGCSRNSPCFLSSAVPPWGLPHLGSVKWRHSEGRASQLYLWLSRGKRNWRQIFFARLFMAGGTRLSWGLGRR